MAVLWSLRGLSWRELVERTCRRSWEDEVFGQAARLAFYYFLAIFPALLLLLVLLNAFADTGSELRNALLDSFHQIVPPEASALITKTVGELNARAAIGAGALWAALGAAWAILNGTWAMMVGLNRAYEVKEERRFPGELVGFLFPHESPNLVALNVCYRDVDNRAPEQLFASFPSSHEQLQDRGVVDVGDPLDGADRAALDQKFQDILGRIQARVHSFESLAGLAEGALALEALVALRAVTVLAKSPNFGVAVVARHLGPCLSSGTWSKMAVGISNPAFGASPRLSLAGSSNYLRGELLSRGPLFHGLVPNKLPFAAVFRPRLEDAHAIRHQTPERSMNHREGILVHGCNSVPKKVLVHLRCCKRSTSFNQGFITTLLYAFSALVHEMRALGPLGIQIIYAQRGQGLDSRLKMRCPLSQRRPFRFQLLLPFDDSLKLRVNRIELNCQTSQLLFRSRERAFIRALCKRFSWLFFFGSHHLRG